MEKEGLEETIKRAKALPLREREEFLETVSIIWGKAVACLRTESVDLESSLEVDYADFSFKETMEEECDYVEIEWEYEEE